MENDLNKNDGLLVEILTKVNALFETLAKDCLNSIIDPYNLEELRKYFKQIRKIRNTLSQPISDFLMSMNTIHMFRKFLLVEEKSIRILALKFLRYNLEITPIIGSVLKKKLFPLIICKLFEEHKYGTFEERLECFKLINTWLKYADVSFPLIFCQAVLAIARGQDEFFKKGSIEFLRNLCVKKPDQSNMIGAFKILINALLDENCIEFSDNIFYTILYIINSSSGRRYFCNLPDFYKIFAIFTKSDFSMKKDSEKETHTNEERNKLEVQLALSRRIIEKLIRTWPGYSLLMGNDMAMGSIVESLNTDTNIVIKKNVLDMIKEFIESDFATCDNFTCLSSGDEFYVNKIYLAYILQGLHNNKLYISLIKFMEKENNPLSDYAQKIILKFVILYSKLSNTDLQLPFLNQRIQSSSPLTNFQNINKNKSEEEIAFTKIKITNLLEQTYFHFNSKDISHVDVKDLSDVVILAMNSVVNLQNVKKYNGQYSRDLSKKELYLVDDMSFQTLLKNSKILELKDFNEWDWKRIDEILDILEYRKELIEDLYKQRFFKKLLYVFMPSKNLFVSLAWNSETFLYASVGAKFFKILSDSVEGVRILDTSPEEYFFSQNKTWYEDVYFCLEQLFNTPTSRGDAKNPFSLKRVCKSMSRQIFVFLGVLSQSKLGEDYLDKKNFYSLMRKALIHSGKFDYIFTSLIDNLNFNTKNAVDLIQDILESGSKRIKRYVFEHIRCLFKFGKEVQWSFKNFKFSIDHDAEVSKIVVNILSSLLTEGKYIEDFFNEKPLIKKISSIQKDILYLMMRNKETYFNLVDFVEEDVKALDVPRVVEKYSAELEENMQEIFNTEDNTQDNFYISINLPKIENQYENFTELFWIKQLPFNINLAIMDESGQSNLETLVLNTYLEFHDSHKLIIYSKLSEDIKINVDRHSIKFICMLGDQIIDNYCRMIYHANFLTFETNDFKSMSAFYKNNNKSEQYFRLEKDGVVINFTKDPNSKSSSEYVLYSIYFYLKINPTKKQSLKTPINLLTELANTEEGMEKLMQTKAVPQLMNYFHTDSISLKLKKASLWILAKICSKQIYGKALNDHYNILDKINSYFLTCDDYAMKGTISYIFCYIAQNRELRSSIECLGWEFFFNSDICLPKDMKNLYLIKGEKFENKKYFDTLDKINKYILLSDKANEIYNNITNLLNTISYKQSYEKLNEIFKNDPKVFSDPHLIIRIYALLSTYKYRQPLRRFILSLFESSFNSNEIMDCCQKVMDNISDDLF